MIDSKRGHVPLWAMLPGLKTGSKEIEAHLRELGYFDTPRGRLLRSTGEAVPTDEEAQKILNERSKLPETGVSKHETSETTKRTFSERQTINEEHDGQLAEHLGKLVEIHRQETELLKALANSLKRNNVGSGIGRTED